MSPRPWGRSLATPRMNERKPRDRSILEGGVEDMTVGLRLEGSWEVVPNQESAHDAECSAAEGDDPGRLAVAQLLAESVEVPFRFLHQGGLASRYGPEGAGGK